MRKRYPSNFWEHHIKKWEESNSPIEKYCKDNNLTGSTFHKWKKQFSTEKAGNGFIEIPLQGKEASQNIIEFSMDEKWNLNIRLNMNFEIFKIPNWRRNDVR